jgi:hypothetical protein
MDAETKWRRRDVFVDEREREREREERHQHAPGLAFKGRE